MEILSYLSSAPYLSIFLCIVWSFIVGFFWYSEWAFGRIWMKSASLKLSEDQMKKGMSRAFGMEVVSSFLLAYVISFLGSMLQTEDTAGLITIGFAAWIGFFLKGLISNCAWEQKPLSYLLINAGSALVTILGMCVILGTV